MATGRIRLMSQKGDTETIWDIETGAGVEEARKQFIENAKKGYLTFEVAPEGGKPVQVKEFNPMAKELVVIPPISGG